MNKFINRIRTMELTPMEMTEHQPKQEPQPTKQQHLDTHCSSDAAQSPSAQDNLEVKSTVDSSDKSQELLSKKQQKHNVQNQKNQTAQSKLAKKNQKQLVGENFERMNYLYQCATRLACLTTPSRHHNNYPISHNGAPYRLTKSRPRIQHGSGNEANSALILSVSDSVPQNDAVIQSGNVASLNRISSDVVTVSKCSSPTKDTSMSTRLGPGNTSDTDMITQSSENSTHGCPMLTSTAVGSHSDQTTLCSDNYSSSNTILPCPENVSSINVSPPSNSELDSNNKLTPFCPEIDSTLNTSQPGTVIDNIIKAVSSCSEMQCSSSNPTVPCSQMDCNTNPTSSCSKLDQYTNPTESCSGCNCTPTLPCFEVDCHTNPTSSCREIASNVSSTCRAVGRKCQLRLSHHMKRELCRGCSTPLVAALTASAKIIRVRKKRVLSVRCLSCGVRRTRPCEDMKTLWADRCATAV